MENILNEKDINILHHLDLYGKPRKKKDQNKSLHQCKNTLDNHLRKITTNKQYIDFISNHQESWKESKKTNSGTSR